MATYCQIDEPVKPTTVSTPSCAAARAVSFISSAARWRTPSARRRPRSAAGRMSWCRSSIGSSQTAWPTRWLEIAQHLQAVLLEHLALARRRSRRRRAPVDLEVVAPAGDLEAVVAPLRRQPGDLLERQVGPLAGEQGDGSGHAALLGRGPSSRRAQERQAVGGELVLARGERPPDGRRRWRWCALSRGERLDAERPGVAGGVERGEDRRPVEVVGAGRAAVVAARPARARSAAPAARHGRGEVALLDVQVVACRAAARSPAGSRVECLQRLVDGVEHAGLVAVERLDARASRPRSAAWSTTGARFSRSSA